MATAKMVDGVAVVAYVNGVAVDANGKPVQGAPKPPKDTDPSAQPGALGAATPEERMGRAIADALSGKTAKAEKDARAARVAASDDEDSGEREPRIGQRPDAEGLPTIANLGEHLAGLKSPAEVRALQKSDERKSAQAHYDARLVELKGK